MNKKLAMLSLGLGLIFTGCQSDVSSENPEEINKIQNAQKEKKHDINKWHDGPYYLEGDSGKNLHEPGAFQGALANCDSYAHYEGDEELMAVYDAPESYHGEIDVKNIVVSDQLNICGTLNVREQVKVNYAGIFNLGGELITEGDVKVNYGGHLVVEGNVVIKGDFVLHNNAILKFLGNDSSIEVLGKAKISKKAIIEGTFKDISQKIK